MSQAVIVALKEILKVVLAIVLLFAFQGYLSDFLFAIGSYVGFITMPFDWISYNITTLKPFVSSLYLSLPFVFILNLIFKYIVHRQSG